MRVRVRVKEMGIKDRLADLDVSIWGEDLHAPLIERLVELPMDIYGGACPSISLTLIHASPLPGGSLRSLCVPVVYI